MKIKKMSALILSCILAASVFAACGENGSSSDGGSSASTSGNSGTDTATEHTITVLGKDRRFDCAPFADRDQYPAWQQVEKLLTNAGVPVSAHPAAVFLQITILLSIPLKPWKKKISA